MPIIPTQSRKTSFMPECPKSYNLSEVSLLQKSHMRVSYIGGYLLGVLIRRESYFFGEHFGSMLSVLALGDLPTHSTAARGLLRLCCIVVTAATSMLRPPTPEAPSPKPQPIVVWLLG